MSGMEKGREVGGAGRREVKGRWEVTGQSEQKVWDEWWSAKEQGEKGKRRGETGGDRTKGDKGLGGDQEWKAEE